MVGTITFEIKGAAELNRVLRTIGPRSARSGGMKALRAAAKPIIAEAKRLVPVRTGDLKRSITTNPKRSRAERELTLLIGFRPPVSRRAHLTEFGTVHSKAQPFIRPALDSQAQAAIDAMGDKFWSVLNMEAKRG